MTPIRSGPRRGARAALTAIALTATLVLTACGGASTSSSTTSAAAGSGGPASGSPASGSAAPGSTAGSSGIEAAQAHVDEATTRPTEINVTTPITKPIPAGKSIIFISCGSPSCSLESDIIKSATDKLGWTLETITTDGSPEQNKSAWQSVVQKKPDAVLYTATDRSTIDAELQAAKAADIFVAACCTIDAPENGINYVIGDAESNRIVGQDLAALTAVNNDGSGSVLYVNLPVFPILSAVKDAFVSGMSEYCPECGVEEMDLPLSAIGKDAPDKIVSAVRANPDIKTVALSVDAIGIGLPAALRAAGLSDKVYVIGEGPVESTLAEIKEGQRGPTNAFPYYESMYSMVDAVIRHEVGDPVEPRGLPSNWVVTQDTVPETDKLFWLVEDGQEQFFKLWGVSGS